MPDYLSRSLLAGHYVDRHVPSQVPGSHALVLVSMRGSSVKSDEMCDAARSRTHARDLTPRSPRRRGAGDGGGCRPVSLEAAESANSRSLPICRRNARIWFQLGVLSVATGGRTQTLAPL